MTPVTPLAHKITYNQALKKNASPAPTGISDFHFSPFKQPHWKLEQKLKGKIIHTLASPRVARSHEKLIQKHYAAISTARGAGLPEVAIDSYLKFRPLKGDKIVVVTKSGEWLYGMHRGADFKALYPAGGPGTAVASGDRVLKVIESIRKEVLEGKVPERGSCRKRLIFENIPPNSPLKKAAHAVSSSSKH
jgi:hypothetical protein